MKKIEKISIITILLGLLFSHMHWKGANEMLILGFTSLGLLYFILGFTLFNGIENRKKISGKRMIFGLVVGSSACILLLSMLFRIHLWQGYREMLIASLAIMIPSLLLLILKGNKPEFRPGLKRIAILCISGIALHFVSIRTQIEYKWKDAPEVIEPSIEWHETRTPEAWGKREEAFRKVKERKEAEASIE
jgi:hypothetical protein